MTTDLTLREAQLKEAARELLQLSGTLSSFRPPYYEQLGVAHHRMHISAALALLATGDVSNGSQFEAIVREVAAEEGDASKCFHSPDALIEAINETRAQQEARG